MLRKMDPAGPRPSAPLEYRRPVPATARPSHPLPAVLFCVPGLICWLALFHLLLARVIRVRLPALLGRWLYPGIFWVWLGAILTAAISLILYVRRGPKPWYVWLNLAVNVSGLLFTLAVMAVVMFA